MLLKFLPLIYIVTTSLGLSSFDKCPTHCTCDIDDEVGYYRTSCMFGGLSGHLDLTNVSQKTEVLNISAPLDNLNTLQIGPIFWNLINLQEIHITRSNIPLIGEYAFLLPKLEVLNLRENRLSTVLENDFKGCPNLTKLYLDDNAIDRLSSGTFKYLINLKVLSLANNRLYELVNRIFERLTKLQELNLSGNNLETINPDVFIDVPELKIFQCRRCGLIKMNGDFFHHIPELQVLDYGYNRIKYIAHDDLAEVPNLKSLWLDGNKISQIDHGTFYYQPDLMKLNLARNKLEVISNGGFLNLSNLADLDLGYNNLKSINPEMFYPLLESLQRLDISGNLIPMSDTKMFIRLLKKLEHIGLGDMELQELPLGLFDLNKHLMSLNLAGNLFIYFPTGALSPVPKLGYLDFSRNKLRGLDSKSLQRIESIEVVNFAGNPWKCEKCHILHMLIKMNSTEFLRNAVCKLPYNLKGRRLADLDLDELRRCSNDDGITGHYFIQQGNLSTIAISCGMLLFVITIFFIVSLVYYTRRHARHYYTHEEKRVIEQEPIFETTDLAFIENGEISFKFPLDNRISISTIEDMKKDPDIQSNGT